VLLTTLSVLSCLGTGLVLAMIGGGGSIIATPLLMYAVGMPSPHLAIGTGAVGVGMGALFGLGAHARVHSIDWRSAGLFAAAGVAGALLGAEAGKAVNGTRLLTLFGLVMIAMGLSLFLGKPRQADPAATPVRHALLRLLGIGFAVGLLAGFFGIGGGFLIVPGLMLAVRMKMQDAVAASLVAVAALGFTSAASYAWSGLVDWRVAGLLVLGGAVGAVAGLSLNTWLTGHKGWLRRGFASFVIAAGLYVSVRGWMALSAG